jgi:hypothetical protein
MNLLCRFRGHIPKLELYVIPKGSHATSGCFGNNVTAVFAINYYGAKVTCKRCGALLDDKNQEERRDE